MFEVQGVGDLANPEWVTAEHLDVFPFPVFVIFFSFQVFGRSPA